MFIRDSGKSIIDLVSRVLSAKAMDPATDSTALEEEIHRTVYERYRLTEDEIAIVEGKNEILQILQRILRVLCKLGKSSP